MKALLFFILFTPVSGFASWYNSFEGGLGYTSNVRFEDSNEDSDFYLYLREYASKEKGHFNMWLSYKDYFDETDYNVFNFRLGFLRSAKVFKLPKWKLDVGLGGQVYTSTNPGTTEESFNSLFLEAAVSRSFKLRPKIELTLEPGYQLKNYTDISGRTDHKFFTNAEAAIQLNPRHLLMPFIEGGIAFSTESIYRRHYYDFGVYWDYEYSPEINVGASVTKSFTRYWDRTVTTETDVSKNRKKNPGSGEADETHDYAMWKVYVLRNFKTIDVKLSGHISNQNSKSGFEDFTELGFLATLVYRH